MKWLYCVSMVTALLMVCEVSPTTTTTTTIAPTPTTTTDWSTSFYTTAGSPVNLKGQMVTMSQNSGVTFYSSYHNRSVRAESTGPPPATANTAFPYTNTTTAWPTTTAPAPRGVTVCLRYLADQSLTLFKLGTDTPLTLSGSSMSWYTLSWSYYSQYQVSMKPIVPIWISVNSVPWASVCVIIDLYKNVVQIFEGGFMSVRKMPSPRLVWSGEPVLDVSGFDGQVTDIEVWDSPLDDRQIFSYMNNYYSGGNVLTWSNIEYKCRGSILLENAFTERQKQPIGSGKRRGQRHRFRKIFKKIFSGRRQMF